MAQNGRARVLTQASNLLRRLCPILGGLWIWEALLKAPFLQAVESGALELSPAFHQKNWQHWFSHIG